MTEIPRIVSADDHVVEPPDVWTSRLPAKYRELGPHVVRAPVAEMTFRGGKYAYAMGDDGPLADWWIYEGRAIPHTRLSACAGTPGGCRRDGSARDDASWPLMASLGQARVLAP